MGQPIPTANPSALIESQIRDCFARVVYSHKTHEKCADICLARFSSIKMWQIALSAVVAGGAVTALFGDHTLAKTATAVVATALLALNTYVKDYDLGALAQKHSETASKLWSARESYLSLLTDLKTGVASLEDAVTKRDQLQEVLGSLYFAAPRTNDKAYKAASSSLQKLGELTFTDAEIDQFLPGPLRSER